MREERYGAWERIGEGECYGPGEGGVEDGGRGVAVLVGDVVREDYLCGVLVRERGRGRGLYGRGTYAEGGGEVVFWF